MKYLHMGHLHWKSFCIVLIGTICFSSGFHIGRKEGRLTMEAIWRDKYQRGVASALMRPCPSCPDCNKWQAKGMPNINMNNNIENKPIWM